MIVVGLRTTIDGGVLDEINAIDFWTRPNANEMHGRDVLTIAGRALVAGYHWDVSSGRKTTISNTFGVWEIKPDGYVNVYPNAHIRGSKKARRVL